MSIDCVRLVPSAKIQVCIAEVGSGIGVGEASTTGTGVGSGVLGFAEVPSNCSEFRTMAHAIPPKTLTNKIKARAMPHFFLLGSSSPALRRCPRGGLDPGAELKG